MSAVSRGFKKIGKTVGGAIGGLFRAPKIVVKDNSQQVADAINQQAADEKKAKEDAELNLHSKIVILIVIFSCCI